ncbi:hypothetical protein [Thiohalophilus sp.]|nr:hypothetical protein [Thiohalophilus sp.]MDZ7660891.1 hypothetical protein [Thiohalophilus sp.]
MTASVTFLAVVVTAAVAMSAVTPLILIYLWIRDWIKEQLW